MSDNRIMGTTCFLLDLDGIDIDVRAIGTGILDHYRVTGVVRVRRAGVGLLPERAGTIGIEGRDLHTVHPDRKGPAVGALSIVEDEPGRRLKHKGGGGSFCTGVVDRVIVGTARRAGLPTRRIDPQRVHIIIGARTGRWRCESDRHGIDIDVGTIGAGVFDHHRVSLVIGVRRAGVGLLPDSAGTVGIDCCQFHAIHKNLEGTTVRTRSIVKGKKGGCLEKEGSGAAANIGAADRAIIRTTPTRGRPTAGICPHWMIGIIIDTWARSRLELISSEITDDNAIVISILWTSHTALIGLRAIRVTARFDRGRTGQQGHCPVETTVVLQGAEVGVAG